VGQARQRCWRYDWVIDLDIKAFFDNLDQSLLLQAVKKHASQQWMVLYIEGWLKAPVQGEDERLVPREKGTPQGGVVSPLLANLFLHYALDRWMAANYAQVPFERYADDVIVHCRTEREAKEVRMAIAERLRDCGLELHPEKTKIVYYYGRFTARRSARSCANWTESWSFGPSVNTKRYVHTFGKLGTGSRASRVVVQSCLPTGSWHVAWLHDGSRMTRECPVRFCERLGVETPRGDSPRYDPERHAADLTLPPNTLPSEHISLGQFIAAAEQTTVRGHPDRASGSSVHPRTRRVDFRVESYSPSDVSRTQLLAQPVDATLSNQLIHKCLP